MLFSKQHIYFLSFTVLTLFVIITANYSQYYIPFGKIVFPAAFCCLLFTFFQELIDYDKTIHLMIYFLICIFVFCFHSLESFQSPNVRLLVDVFFACSFLRLKREARLWVYDKFIRVLAILLFLGIIEYVLFYIGISFVVGESTRPGTIRIFNQGLLNLIPLYSIGFFRFQFITEEPGYMGTLLFFIIATLNCAKYKKEFIVFTIAGVITFSLAFYLLVLLWGISKLKPSNYKFLLIPLILYAFFYEPINDRIIDRVITKSEDGSLDNRNHQKVLDLYEDMWNDGRFIIGVGNRTFENLNLGGGSGVKYFMVLYGVVGLLLVSASFSVLFFKYNKFNYSNLTILLLFWFSFYQRCDLNLEPNIVILFSYGLAEKNFFPQEQTEIIVIRQG